MVYAKNFLQPSPSKYALSSLEAAVRPSKCQSGAIVPKEIWPV